MPTPLVKYDNSLNQVQLSKLSATNSNIFFALCHQFKERGTETITISFDDLKRLSQWKGGRDPARFAENLYSVMEKIIQMSIITKTDKIATFLTLFSKFTVDNENKLLTAEISPHFTYLLNDLQADFTRWELPEFLSLKSNYAKTLYRHLKQFRSTGMFTTSIEHFRHLMNVPKAYPIHEVTRRVIDPAIEELRPIFPGLNWSYKKEKGAGNRGRGGTVTGIIFIFNTQILFFEEYKQIEVQPISEGRG